MQAADALRIHVASSADPDPWSAVEELRAQRLAAGLPPTPRAALFFCDGLYPLQDLADALSSRFDCPLTGCISGSQIGPQGFRPGGISLLSLDGDGLDMRIHLIEPILDPGPAVQRITAELAAWPPAAGRRQFGLLLVDGLHQGEERLAHALYHGLGDVPFIGGSASDDMRFEHTPVYFGGRFRSNVAVFAVFETAHAFLPFRVQNFQPRVGRLVITEADPERRLVIQINGLPAAEAYAEALGLPESALEARVLEAHPLLVRVGQEHVVRAIQRVTRSRALLCMSAVDAGVVAAVGDAQPPLAALERSFEEVRQRLGAPALVLGCDCTLRRRQAARDNQLDAVGELLAAQRVFGFSTHGEQYNGMHINQSFTAIAVSAR
ncbi:MAG: FIST C-terminal domain-containing protein [Aquimonas sp.]|nr:FIST C-terminal domain-containing protein [Aquimonas sp.]